MKFLITENRLKELFKQYMDRQTKNLIMSENEHSYGHVSWREPDVDVMEISTFDFEPDYEYYEENNKDMPNKNYKTIFWVKCEMYEDLQSMFGLGEDNLNEMIKDWAENKYDIRITTVTCQG